VLFFLAVNTFLALAVIASVLLRLGDTSDGYIQQYRSNLGLNGYRVGGVGEMVSFVVFAVILFVFQLFISFRVYDIKKQAAWTVLVLTTLLLILSLFVSSALIQLR
jgi:hypothetical protein